jgi:hypothetical protein
MGAPLRMGNSWKRRFSAGFSLGIDKVAVGLGVVQENPCPRLLKSFACGGNDIIAWDSGLFLLTSSFR